MHDQVLPGHHPRLVLKVAARQGADPGKVLEGTGLTEAMLAVPEARMSYAQYGVLIWNAMRLTNNPGLGIDVGRRLHLTNLGVLGLAVMSSPTLGEALQLLIRHVTTIAPASVIEFKRQGDAALLTVGSSLPQGRFAAFGAELTLASFATQGTFLYGDDLPVLEVRCAYPEPSYAHRYREIYDVAYVFDAPRTEVLVSSEVLDAEIPFADPTTAMIAERSHAQNYPPATASGGLVGQVTTILDASEGGGHELDQVARRLQTSGRSLRRALQEMGTSFQQLRDQSRQARALQWTETTEMTFEDMAHRLGFSDVRSFRRAFKRWTGELPGAARRRARSAAAEP